MTVVQPQVVQLLIAAGDTFETASVPRLELDHDGIRGDRHAGRFRKAGPREKSYTKGMIIPNNRQVSLIAAEELELICNLMGLPVLRPEWLGANIVTRGLPNLTQTISGTRLRIGSEVVLVVHYENFPCGHPGGRIAAAYPEMEDLRQSFKRHAQNKRGLVAWVECGGVISDTDNVVVVPLSEIVS